MVTFIIKILVNNKTGSEKTKSIYHSDISCKVVLVVLPFAIALPFMVSDVTECAAMAILSSQIFVFLSSFFNNVTIFIARLNMPCKKLAWADATLRLKSLQ